MKYTFFKFLVVFGVLTILFGCEKDETKIILKTDPTPPALTAVPEMLFSRENGADTIVFMGNAVDPGFTASATYFLEAAPAEGSFDDGVEIYSGVSVDEITLIASDVNSKLLKIIPADQTTSVSFRIRSVLLVDAGTGAPGTSSNPFEYISDVQTANVFVYGLPRLDLVGAEGEQKVESALGNGDYFGIVKVDPDLPFTLVDPDTETSYGGSGETLSVDGPAIVPPAVGWHKMYANTVDLTYSFESYMIGLVGSATPNGWDTPDQKMDYDPATGTWNITIDLVVGEIKFRLNDGWAWNLGGTPDNLVHNGDNIPIDVAGNYTISLTITNETAGEETGTFTITLN
jgi:starch-binding outer membrane protein SusE/F